MVDEEVGEEVNEEVDDEVDEVVDEEVDEKMGVEAVAKVSLRDNCHSQDSLIFSIMEGPEYHHLGNHLWKEVISS